MSDEQHFPDGTVVPGTTEVPESPAPEVETPEEGKEPETPAEEPRTEEPAPETPAQPDEPLPKKRSIYDDLKDKKQEAREASERAEAEKARADAAEAELAKLRGKPPEATVTPEKKDEPIDELDAFAKEQDMDPVALKRLTEILASRIPASQLSPEEKQTLADLTAFKADADAREARRAEDDAILATAPTVKEQLAITDDKELSTVMAEITRLAHTQKYADKEIDYIVFREREALAKLVSPKKASFEAGGDQGDAPADTDVDFSKGGLTPEQAQRGASGRTASALEIKKAK